MPILNGRIGKWILALSEFELKFESAKAIKGQIIADFITKHRDPSVDLLEITPWALLFDGSSCGKGGGVGILLISPRGEMFEFAIPIQPTVTNNQAEYEALLRGLQYPKEAGVVSVIWTSLGPLPRWVPGPTTRWAPGTTRLALHGT
jgi:hypothetical protein